MNSRYLIRYIFVIKIAIWLYW